MTPDTQDYVVRIWYSPAPGVECFVAQVLDLPGIMAHGESREAAAREIQAALQNGLEVYIESGMRPPAPKNHAAVTLGSRGGSARTKSKRLAAKRNGALGGRPRKRRSASAATEVK
jgi:predicted RNase H-like HicB family nuclease